MRRMITGSLLLGGILFAPPFAAQDLDGFFTAEKGKERLDQIGEALIQFRDFTRTVFEKSNLTSTYDVNVLYESSIPDDADIRVDVNGRDFQRDGYLNWDMQHIGFPNWVKYVRGYIEYQELQNMKLRLQVATLESIPDDSLMILNDTVTVMENRLREKYLEEDEWVD